jgi:hypothetical protein
MFRRLRWLPSAVAVLVIVGLSAGLAPTSHRPPFIWRIRDLFPVAQSLGAPCVHRLCLVRVVDSSLRAV